MHFSLTTRLSPSSSSPTALKVIVVPLVVDYEWSSKAQNQVLENYGSVTIPLSIKPRYLSICGGQGSILAVSGIDVNQLNRILLFDLTDLNAVNQDLKPFATVDLPTASDIIDLDWHPEFNESLFLAVLSTGELISVGVNLSKRSARILCTLSQNAQVTCASWSPKGKQFVIGKKNGEIVQVKHKDGSAFEEAKKIGPDPELAGYEVNAIKWCFTPLFMVSFAKVNSEADFDVKHITVYAPPKVVPTFYNHTQLCIENFRGDLRYRTEFVHLGPVILCSTSFSSEIGVLVCDDTDRGLDTWAQLMLADDHRVELPINRNVQTLSKGLAMYLNATKVFKISDVASIGGPNTPLMMILNSDGVLCSFYVTFPRISYPPQLATKQLEFQIIPQTSQQAAALNQSAIQQQQTPTKSFTAQQQPNTPQQPQVPPNQQAVNQQQVLNQQQQQQLINQQKALQEQEKLLALQLQQKAAADAAKEAELQREKERKAIIEENHAYLVAIDEEIRQFSRLVLESKERYQRTNSQIVGKESDKRLLVDLTNGLEADLEQIGESMKGIDIALLENFLFENFAMAENAKSRAEREKDSKLNLLFQKKPLDPATQRKLKEINNKTIYIETNLKEINYILDQQWQDYIVSEKGKKASAVSPVNLVYQALANNHRILNSLEGQLRVLGPLLPWKDINHKLNYKKQDIKKLTSCLKKTILDDDELNENGQMNGNHDDDNLIEIHRFTKKNRQNLQRILDSRPEIPIKRSSLPVDMNSAIMISAISKAKEKLKLSKRHVEKHGHSGHTVRRTSESHHHQQHHHQQRLPQPVLGNKMGPHQKIPTGNVPAGTMSSPIKQVPSQQQVKTSGTFMPAAMPVAIGPMNLQQKSPQIPMSSISSPQPIGVQPQMSKPGTAPAPANLSKAGEPFKFSFNQNISSKQQINFSTAAPPKFGSLEPAKPAQQPPKPAAPVKTTLAQLPPISSVNIFTSNAPVSFAATQSTDKPAEFAFKPDQLNLTFDRSQLNLLSSTPIKTQQQLAQLQQQQQQKDAQPPKATPPLFGSTTTPPTQQAKADSSNQPIDAAKQALTTTPTLQQTPSKSDDQQSKPAATSGFPRYEDISPATTPTIDPKQATPSSLPSSTAKPSDTIDASTFSFNALAALSKLPVVTTFGQSPASTGAPLFSSAAATPATGSQPLGSLSSLQNIQANQSAPKTSESASPFSTPGKSLFGQSLPASASSAQPASLALGTSSIFSQPPPKDATQPQTGGLFGQNTSIQAASNTTGQTPLFGNASLMNKTTSSSAVPEQSLTNAPKSNTTVTTTSTSIFSMNTTGLNLSKKDTAQPTSTTQTTVTSTAATQPSILTPQANVQSPFSTGQTAQQPASVTSPFSSQAVSTPSQTQPQQQQSAFGFSMASMCSLGGKPNPENEKKNPFGSTVSVSTPSQSTGLLFGNSQPTGAFGSSPPAFGSATSAFQSSTATTGSPFGQTSSPFGAMSTTMSTSSIFPNANTSTIAKPAFGMASQQPQQQASLFGKPVGPFGQPADNVTTSPFGQQQQQQPQNTSGFGAKPTFGAAPAFGSPSSSFKFGSQATFGSQMSPPSTSFTQPPKTGFERFVFVMFQLKITSEILW